MTAPSICTSVTCAKNSAAAAMTPTGSKPCARAAICWRTDCGYALVPLAVFQSISVVLGGYLSGHVGGGDHQPLDRRRLLPPGQPERSAASGADDGARPAHHCRRPQTVA